MERKLWQKPRDDVSNSLARAKANTSPEKKCAAKQLDNNDRLAQSFFEESWPLSRLGDALPPDKPDVGFLSTRAPVRCRRQADPSPTPSPVCAGVTQHQPEP
jgi:hypothetical protein